MAFQQLSVLIDTLQNIQLTLPEEKKDQKEHATSKTKTKKEINEYDCEPPEPQPRGKPRPLDPQSLRTFIETAWKKEIEPTLCKYIEIPNLSPDYDAQIHTNGHQDAAVKLLIDWVLAQKVEGLKVKVLHDKGRTPLIYIEVSSSDRGFQDAVLMYGHFDKQPPLTSDWRLDLHPYKPCIKDGKLYGRGGANDGYAIFAAVTAIKALQDQNTLHPRCCILIEGSEESGSPDLFHYIEKLRGRIELPSVVMCLDSGCQNYEQLWLTVSLRGVVITTLRAQLLREAIHSGDSGLVRDSFHVLRMILDRIDDPPTGTMLRDLYVEIPELHIQYAKDCAAALGDAVYTQLPFHNEECCPQIEKCKEEHMELHELILNKTWRPQLSITGADGLPDLKGGNVLRKYTTLKLSVRIPPSLDPLAAQSVLKAACQIKPTPFGANVECDIKARCGAGFVCPEFSDWLIFSLHQASKAFFGRRAQFTGDGGSIPFMNELLKKFPMSQFVIMGILGPQSNAHGPNEFLHIDFTKKVICCVSSLLYDIARRDFDTKPSDDKMCLDLKQRTNI